MSLSKINSRWRFFKTSRERGRSGPDLPEFFPKGALPLFIASLLLFRGRMAPVGSAPEAELKNSAKHGPESARREPLKDIKSSLSAPTCLKKSKYFKYFSVQNAAGVTFPMERLCKQSSPALLRQRRRSMENAPVLRCPNRAAVQWSLFRFCPKCTIVRKCFSVQQGTPG